MGLSMFVANCTNQVQTFIYRLPEIPAPRTQEIGIGRQVKLSGDLTQQDIDAVVAQHAKYGLKSVAEVEQRSNGRAQVFVGLVYSDKPISVEKVRRALLQNHNVLVERGRDERKAAAVAANEAIQQQTEGSPLALQALDLSVEQVQDKNNPTSDFNEGVRVSSNETDTEVTGRPGQGNKGNNSGRGSKGK